MSLFTHPGRVEVSSGDSELDSIASSIADSADELIEELARMALAGHYSGAPRAYETNELLQGRGMVRRPRDVAYPRPSVGPPRQPTSSSPASSSGPPSYQGRERSNTRDASSWPQCVPYDADEAERDACALEKMYRRLAREYRGGARSVGPAASPTKAAGTGKHRYTVANGDSAWPPLSDAAAAARRTNRRLDERAQLRLAVLSKAPLARRAEKYERRKEREAAARRHPKPLRVSAKAVKRGTRLFLEAQERANNTRRMQESLARQKAAQEKRECTFHPSVSNYAAQLAADGAYCSLESRLANQAAHDEKRLRLRLEREVELEKECTFKPTLSPGTEELLPILRCRRERRHLRRTLRTSGCERLRRSRRGRVSSPTHEPFEAGERLYRDGGERLLRQQVRLQRMTAKEQRHVVGGGLRLSHADAQQLADRLTAWAAACAMNREELRLALEQQEREPAYAGAKREVPTGQVDGLPLRRAASNLNGSVFAPPLAKLPGSDRGSSGPATSAAMVPPPLRSGHYYAPSKTSARGCSAAQHPEVSLEALNRARPVRLHADAAFVATGAGAIRSQASPSAPARSPAVDVSVQKELLRIHLGALFYKYATFPTATAVCLAQIKQQVRCYYPEDSGIVAALASSFTKEQELITKTDFMAALARYVVEHGIQPWCLPHRSVPNAFVNEPYSSRTSSHPSSAAAVATSDSVSSSDLSHTLSNDAVVSTPSWTGTRTSSGAPDLRNEVDCWAVALATEGACKNETKEKPLRTHIYAAPLYPHCSPPTRAQAVPTPKLGEETGVGTALTATRRGVAADKPKETTCDGSQSRALSKRTRPLLTSTVTAELVRGYEDYVQRQRRAIDRARAASGEGRNKLGEICTFRPTLTPRSVMLSDRNLEKRMAYARELHLRKHRLHLLHTAVLAEQSGKGGSPGAAGSGGGAATCGALASTQTPPPTPSTQHPSTPLSSASPLSCCSPLIEVSSLSCSTPRHESGSAPSKPTRTLPSTHEDRAAGDAGLSQAMAVLEQLLKDTARKECSTQTAEAAVRELPPSLSVQGATLSAVHDAEMTARDVRDATQTVDTAPQYQFCVTRPAQPILSAEEEHLAPRHSEKTLRAAD
ncbi:hypothetical protein LSCM1_01172 [Leishmania martiniquensis]|uniref:Uncharacterized protein n=1 Tax=Leishmania martiniquensis TaxID=1580590 RepID=A0A836G5Z7_9TRYP|nr:hypothetical protein LSCM1_01172 [Leishmania martiniquensis]